MPRRRAHVLVPFPIAVSLYLAGSNSTEERLRWARDLGDTVCYGGKALWVVTPSIGVSVVVGV